MRHCMLFPIIKNFKVKEKDVLYTFENVTSIIIKLYISLTRHYQECTHIQY